VRRCLRDDAWRGYQRRAQAETLLAPQAEWLRRRASQVRYSARILYQELKAQRGYQGSYETVKRFVAPLRELASSDALTQTRFETAPGHQSQVDWGQVRVAFGSGPSILRIFVLTLGFSRRGFYWAYPDERLNQFLEAHERAFAHFGGLTAEHLYDRPRTVCYPNGRGRVVWNPTFKAFAEHWGFEPRVCRAYRAQTKGKVESGVKCLGARLSISSTSPSSSTSGTPPLPIPGCTAPPTKCRSSASTRNARTCCPRTANRAF
jgi:transposase